MNRPFFAIKTSTVALAFGLMASTSTVAYAQTIPNAARPDVVEQRNRIDDARPAVGGAPLISMPQEEAKSLGQGLKFTLKGIELEGAKTFKAGTLEKLYADQIGTQVTLGTLNGIAAEITAYYRNKGYILTRAIVPPQRAEGGIVTIRIIEGYVSNVTVQGDRADDALIQKYAEKIRASKPLDAKKLERYLLLMEDLPGVEARAVLQPSKTQQGASEVVVTLKRKMFDFSATLDNRGSRYLGPYQASANLFVNDAIGLDEQTQFRFANSIFQPDELVYGEIRHEEQLGSEGTKLLISANHVETEPGYSLEALDTEGDSTAFTVGLSYPITRSRQSNWFVNTDLTARNVSVDNFAGDVYYDKTRVLNIGTAYDFLDSTSAINRMEANIAKGFNLGADVDGQSQSRSTGKTSFEKISGRASRIQPISGPWAVYGAITGQYALDPLLASEEMSLGGTEFGSAYDSAEISGDSGIAGRAELQYNNSLESAFLSQYQLYTFYDIGKVWNRNVVAGTEAEEDSLSSTGLGARFNILDSLSGGVEGSVPLTRKVAAYGDDGASPRLFFNLLYRY